MDDLLDSDTGYVGLPLVQLCNLADTAWILEVRIHVQEPGEKDVEYGTHGRIKKTFDQLDIVEVLKTEFKSRRGRVMVSRKSRPSHHHTIQPPTDIVTVCADRVMADKARKEVQQRMNKRVRLVELDFQPSLRETGWPSATDMEFKCIG
jgi:hypothetical protein